ncbi:MAG: hypothetical protein DMG68_04665 [Acidobacteria bacterium]|nr:MAG: hypothetical protein DMG68_04665 [Acidobacteriota bacterium]
MRKLFVSLCISLFLGSLALAAEVHPPAQVTAGNSFSISTTGSGNATFYLVGPSHVLKRDVKLGQEITVGPDDVKIAGRYVAIACGSDGCNSAALYVGAGAPDRLSFLLHPSRVPVKAGDAINATAFVFDKFHNPVLKPVDVNFRVEPKDSPAFTRTVKSIQGVAWIRMGSTAKGGPVKVTASVGSASEPRIIQQVASDACNLRIKASPGKHGYVIETDPVKDCSGNMVPDGTVVSFTKVDASGKSTVDAPIKKGVARTELPVNGKATISVASGVVIGNEISLGGRS